MSLFPAGPVALVAEELSARPDEGALRVLERFGRFLAQSYEFRAFYTRGEAPEGIKASRVRFTRAGVSGPLRKELRQFDPGVVLYAPSASITVNAMWRARQLRAATGAPVVLMGLQKREYGPLARLALHFLRPDVLVVASQDVAERFSAMGWDVVIMRLGVDLARFQPLSFEARARLRSGFGWDDGRRVVLHVGHLRANRGIRALVGLARNEQNRVVFVASASERGEEELEGPLIESGVEVRREFIPQIEHYYQAADAYVFPVEHATSAIDFPLSVLEALACGLPTLTTRYGALPEYFDGGGGLRFFDSASEADSALTDLLGEATDPAVLARGFDWETGFEELVAAIEKVLS